MLVIAFISYAHPLRMAGLFCLFMSVLWQAPIANAAGRNFEAQSTNFHVYAPDGRLAQKVVQEAERYRSELAILWLGHELDAWSERCPIKVELGMHAGGETSFAFVTDGRSYGKPIGWKMKISGPPDRLLDAVLPHEITHTIFATHFGRPLPRWADEGACTTVEHQSERNKNHHMLINFLTASPSRGIPFNRMFTMTQYPHDILPLYAQGHSVAKFVIMQKGRRTFLDYLQAGMDRQRGSHDVRAWDDVTQEFYGFRDLSDLQLAWIAWVKAGSVEQTPDDGSALALASHTTEVESAKVASAGWNDSTPSKESLDSETREPKSTKPVEGRLASANLQAGWYARQARIPDGQVDAGRVSTNRRSLSNVLPSDSRKPSYLEDSRVGSQTLWR